MVAVLAHSRPAAAHICAAVYPSSRRDASATPTVPLDEHAISHRHPAGARNAPVGSTLELAPDRMCQPACNGQHPSRGRQPRREHESSTSCCFRGIPVIDERGRIKAVQLLASAFSTATMTLKQPG